MVGTSSPSLASPIYLIEAPEGPRAPPGPRRAPCGSRPRSGPGRTRGPGRGGALRANRRVAPRPRPSPRSESCLKALSPSGRDPTFLVRTVEPSPSNIATVPGAGGRADWCAKAPDSTLPMAGNETGPGTSVGVLSAPPTPLKSQSSGRGVT